MKITIVLSGFNGGAPRSLLQYSKILKAHGHQVLVCGKKGSQSLVQEYKTHGIEVYESVCGVDDARKLKKLRGVADVLNYTLKWSPDCIIAVGLQLSNYISNVVKNLGVQCLCLIPGGNLESGKNIIKKIKCSRAIVFSTENKLQLERYGFIGDVCVISNRIPMTDRCDIDEHYSERTFDTFHFLLASRLSSGKSNSVKYVIDFVEWLNKKGYSADLEIAGDGNCFGELVEYTNLKSNMMHKIRFLGMLSDMEQHYENADVCFGKGRSILEPLIGGRYVVCVSEDRKMKWVDTGCFSQLECYNFSGRNIENPDSFEQIETFIRNISSKERRDSLRKAKSMAEQQYGSDYLEKKFYDNFFELYYENCKFEVRKVPCKLSLYAKVFVCWLGGRG